jgi:hypothetical protein
MRNYSAFGKSQSGDESDSEMVPAESEHLLLGRNPAAGHGLAES